MELLLDPAAWVSFTTLLVLELVLGIDNLVFLAILADRLPPARQAAARRIGLGLALVARLAMLGGLAWLTRLTAPVLTVAGHGVSWRDMILIAGGAFLIWKAVREIHHRMEGADAHAAKSGATAGFAATIVQIVLIDAVFSIDSVLTAVGVADEVAVMAAAITVAVVVMLAASGPLAGFVRRHPTVKMLALAFLVLIGTTLVADGVGVHLPRGTIYAAMGFAALVEGLNLLAARRRQRPSGTRLSANISAQARQEKRSA